MKESKTEKHRILVTFAFTMFLIITAVSILYAILGHKILESIYKGATPIPFLNALFKSKEEYPLAFYFNKADIIFDRIIIAELFIILFFLIIV